MKRLLLNPGILIFAACYLGGFFILTRNPNFQAGDALFELAIFGIILPLLAWLFTRRAQPLTVAPPRSGNEMLLVLGLIVALALYLVNGPQAIDSLLPRAWIDSAQAHFFVVLAKKLIVFVFIPYLLFRLFFGHHWADFGWQTAGLRELLRSHLPVVLVLSLAFLAFNYFLGGGAAPVRKGELTTPELLIGLPLCFLWLVIEAGLVEEFFFRAVVQTRLAAWLKSESAGVALMALVFGLAHAPGYIFRHAAEVEGLGANPSALDAIAYAIVVVAPAAFVFGVVWARTKNLFAVMIIHAAGDLLPNVTEFVKTWNIK